MSTATASRPPKSKARAKFAARNAPAPATLLQLPKLHLALPCPPEKVAVPLRLHFPDAGTVSIAGGFNDWEPSPLQRDGDGFWSIELGLPPGVYEYLFVVDDQWLPDPACESGCPNPFGGENSHLRV